MQEIDTIDAVRRSRTREVHIYTLVDQIGEATFPSLKTVLGTYPGRCPVVLHLRIPGESETEMLLSEAWNVTPSDGLIEDLERAIQGADVVLR
jgi:hypothetical protein